MREIKFRVWDKVTKQMFTGFHLFGEMTLVGGIHAWQDEEAEKIGIKRDTLGALNDLIEMQYTGLKDVNGKEIYEGDIVISQDGEKCRIDFYSGSFNATYLPPADWDPMEPCRYLDEEFEVIGNIYENPELLNG